MRRTALSRIHVTIATVLGRSNSVKGKAGGIVFLMLAAALGACVNPAFVPDGLDVAQPVRQAASDVTVEIAANAWSARPSDLTDTILPVLVVLRNTGTQPVIVSRQDFAMIDQNSRQYFPIPPAEVTAMLGGGSSGVGVHPSVGFGGSSAGGSFIGGGVGFSFDSGAGARDVIPLALADGPVQPGAEARGFLYFPRPAPNVKRMRVVVAIRTVTGPARLEFHFHRGE